MRLNGRDDWIRTSDPLTPSQVRYQAAPHPDAAIVLRNERSRREALLNRHVPREAPHSFSSTYLPISLWKCSIDFHGRYSLNSCSMRGRRRECLDIGVTAVLMLIGMKAIGQPGNLVLVDVLPILSGTAPSCATADTLRTRAPSASRTGDQQNLLAAGGIEVHVHECFAVELVRLFLGQLLAEEELVQIDDAVERPRRDERLRNRRGHVRRGDGTCSSPCSHRQCPATFQPVPTRVQRS